MTLLYDKWYFCTGGSGRGHKVKHAEAVPKGRGYLFCPDHPRIRLRIRSHHPRRDREHLRI